MTQYNDCVFDSGLKRMRDVEWRFHHRGLHWQVLASGVEVNATLHAAGDVDK